MLPFHFGLFQFLWLPFHLAYYRMQIRLIHWRFFGWAFSNRLKLSDWIIFSNTFVREMHECVVVVSPWIKWFNYILSHRKKPVILEGEEESRKELADTVSNSIENVCYEIALVVSAYLYYKYFKLACIDTKKHSEIFQNFKSSVS